MSQIIKIKNTKTVEGTWAGTLLPSGAYVTIDPDKLDSWRRSLSVYQDIGSGILIVNNGSDTVDDFTDPIQAWNWILGNPATDSDGTPLVSLGPKTSDDKRNILAVNRIPEGYTIFYTGVSDDITLGVPGKGNVLVLDASSGGVKTLDFQLLKHFYISGGKALWEGASLGTYIDVDIVAPACSGIIAQTNSDFIKTEVVPSSGAYIIVPAATPGTGDYALDLKATINLNTDILQCSPVPNPSGTGWFNYNPVTNILTIAPRGDGAFDLYDFDVRIFSFLRNGWAKPGVGSETNFETSGVISKLFLNSWKLRFSMVSIDTTSKCFINMVVACTKNV